MIRSEILPGFPQTDEERVQFGGQQFFSEGFVVRFFDSNDGSWIGNFSRGYSSFSDVFPIANSTNFLVAASGRVYLIDATQRSLLQEYGDANCSNPIKLDDGRVIFSSLSNIFVIEAGGEIWESERIGWDGLKDLKIGGDIVSGLSWELDKSSDNWIPFSVNLKTRNVTGGSYENYRQLDA